ncbi:MAG: HAMP domain-containing sensor histidine kinase [bacterium]|nr:HAMP domain-containing sensor histidine kinase [bacterium]
MWNSFKKEKKHTEDHGVNEHSITEVTSIISHQLKTPLSGIKSSLEVILSGDLGKLTKDQNEYLTLALDSTNKTIRLVRDLLDATRIEEGRLSLNSKSADVAAIIKDSVKGLVPLALAKNTSIDMDIPDGLPLAIIDPIKIQEVVNNILFNAIKYSKGKGEIKTKLSKDKACLIFECKDSGIGISKEDESKIFSKFYRSPRVSELAPDGSGLGLFIAKAIIEKHGGKIWFESEEGHGTTFYFTLPIK